MLVPVMEIVAVEQPDGCAARANGAGRFSSLNKGEFVIEVVRRSAASLAADRFFYGWAMVAIAGLGVFVKACRQ